MSMFYWLGDKIVFNLLARISLSCIYIILSPFYLAILFITFYRTVCSPFTDLSDLYILSLV